MRRPVSTRRDRAAGRVHARQPGRGRPDAFVGVAAADVHAAVNDLDTTLTWQAQTERVPGPPGPTCPADGENFMTRFDDVLCHPIRAGARPGHELATLEWIGREVAGLLALDYAGLSAAEAAASPRRRLHVPDATLTRAQADALGIDGTHDLLGGIVPYAVVATKAISHPLVRADAAAAEGWCHTLGERLAEVTLPGYTAFARADAMEAFQRLHPLGPVRLKVSQGVGGLGQWIARDADTLASQLAALDDVVLAESGVVLETHLHDARTFSVGALVLDGEGIAYHGVQSSVLDLHGREVYGGSQLWVMRGDLRDLLQAPLPPGRHEMVARACQYDRQIAASYPTMRLSRRNYDLIEGSLPSGARLCGVLEQSWRIGGATPAELAALAYLRANPQAAAVRAGTGEIYDAQPLPPGAEVFYLAGPGASGPACKFRTCTADDG